MHIAQVSLFSSFLFLSPWTTFILSHTTCPLKSLKIQSVLCACLYCMWHSAVSSPRCLAALCPPLACLNCLPACLSIRLCGSQLVLLVFFCMYLPALCVFPPLCLYQSVSVCLLLPECLFLLSFTSCLVASLWLFWLFFVLIRFGLKWGPIPIGITFCHLRWRVTKCFIKVHQTRRMYFFLLLLHMHG